MEPIAELTPADLAILTVLVNQQGRVLSRASLLRHAGMTNSPERRCDASLVSIRRALGRDAIVTVRQRGWMLNSDMIASAVLLLTNAMM